MPNLKSAVVRAVRTFLQVLAAGLVAVPTVDAVTDITNLRDPILLVLWFAMWGGIVSLVQNLAETMGSGGGENLPRG